MLRSRSPWSAVVHGLVLESWTQGESIPRVGQKGEATQNPQQPEDSGSKNIRTSFKQRQDAPTDADQDMGAGEMR